MSWNLFGSPYLCAMKYTDMEYGRVIYGYQDGKYVPPIQTYPEDDGTSAPKGYIPADAVFTQTATLKYEERFTVQLPTARNSETAYANQETTLKVAIAQRSLRPAPMQLTRTPTSSNSMRWMPPKRVRTLTWAVTV